MADPVGGAGSPPPSSIPPTSTPTPTINVTSPSVFGLISQLVQVIQVARSIDTSQFRHPPINTERNVRPVPASNVNLRNIYAEAEDPESNSPQQVKAIDNVEGPRIRGQERGDGKEPAATVTPQGKQEQPPGLEVPDLTDRSRRPVDDKMMQRLIADMRDRIAKLVRDMSLIKQLEKNEIREDVIELQKLKKEVMNSFIDARAEKMHPKNERTFMNDLRNAKNEGDVDSHHVDLIIEGIAEDGHVEKLSVERGDIAELLDNLEGLISAKEVEALQQIDASLHMQAPDSTAQQQTEVASSNAQKGFNAASANQPNASVKLPGTQAQASIETSQPSHASPQPQALPPGAAAAAMASFMPFVSPTKGGQGISGGEEGFRVGQVEEGHGGSNRSGADTTRGKATEKPPIEAATAERGTRKSIRQRDVQAIADTAKADRTKKTNPVRIGDEKMVQVPGKFTLDARGIRRRREKGEGGGGGSGGQAEAFRLIDILYMVLSAVVCGSQTVFDITAFVETNEAWFKTALGLRSGLPSTRLITKLIVGFDPNQMSEMINVWIREAQGAAPQTKLASIMVSESFEGLIFFQERSGHPSTAPSCIPRLLQFFDMRGVVTLVSNGPETKKFLDAMVSSGAHFIYDCGEDAIPGEQEILPLIENAIASGKARPPVHHVESYLEGQEYLQIYEVGTDQDNHIQSIAQLLAEVITDEGKEEVVQYFVSDLPRPSVYLFELLRVQRPLEAKAEWMLNMSLRGKHRDEIAFAAREFLALIRRHAVGLLLRDHTNPAALYARMQRAAQDPEYRMKLLRL